MAKETLEMVSNHPPSLLTDGAQVSQEEDESKENEASLNAIPVRDLEEEILPVQEEQIVKGDSKEDEASTNVEGANTDPQAENHQAESIMEPSFTVLKGSKKRAQNRRVESGLPMKKKRHLCCSTCVGDRTYSPLCHVLEDKQDCCLCQQAKGIIEDELGIVGDKKLVYMEKIRATPHGNQTVKYEDVSFTGEIQRCTALLI